jgi:DNA-binding Xre family transcriptional regulator
MREAAMRRVIILRAEETQELERRFKARTAAVRERQRAQIVLLAARGFTQDKIAEEVGVSRVTVNHWCHRFDAEGLEGLDDAPGRGRKPVLSADKVRRVLEEVGQPPKHLGRWSCRTMAKATGLSKATVQRLWAANDIKPHVTKTFKVSNDPNFIEKFWDVIGLYLNPPDKAIVLCCDEKSQCQALERTRVRGKFCVSGRMPVMGKDGELSERLFPFLCADNSGAICIFQAQKITA